MRTPQPNPPGYPAAMDRRRFLQLGAVGSLLLPWWRMRAEEPAPLPGMRAWYRSDAGLFQDLAMQVPALAENDPVAVWADLSGNGLHLRQTVPERRPRLGPVSTGQPPAVRFVAASQQYLQAAEVRDWQFLNVEGGSVFVVWRTLQANPTMTCALVATGAGRPEEPGFLFAYHDPATPPPSDGLLLRFSDGIGYALNASWNYGVVIPQAFSVLRAAIAPPVARVEADGLPAWEVTGRPAAIAGPSAPLTVGRAALGEELFLDGEVRELIVADSSVNAALPGAGQRRVSIAPLPGRKVSLYWQPGDRLESADRPEGPWQQHPDKSPPQVFDPVGTQRYYRSWARDTGAEITRDLADRSRLQLVTEVRADGAYNAFPGLCRAGPDGFLICYRKGTSHATDRGRIVTVSGDPTGRTWSQEVVVARDNLYDLSNPSLLRLRNGQIVLSYFERDPVLNHSRPDSCTLRFSGDQGATWGAPFRLKTSFAVHSFGSAPILELPDGRLLQALAGSNPGDSVSTARVMVVSSDLSSVREFTIADGPRDQRDYIEPNLALLPTGRLLCLLRTNTRSIYQCVSDDGGESWTSPQEAFMGDGSPRVIQLESGRLVSLTRSQQNGTASRAVLHVSTDGGTSWSADEQIVDASLRVMLYGAMIEPEPGWLAMAYSIRITQTRADVRFRWRPESVLALLT